MRAKHPGQVLPDGRRSAPAADAGEADAGRLLPPPLRLAPRTCCKARRTRSRPANREGRARLPAARHRHRQLHPLRPRLLGRADDRALCRRGSGLGGEARTRRCASSPTRRPATAIPTCTSKLFGADYKPEPYIVEEYKRARKHKWYMTSRLICVNDIYSFDPERQGQPRRFRRHHRPQLQAAEGRPRPRQQSVGAHVAHHDVADAVFVRL